MEEGTLSRGSVEDGQRAEKEVSTRKGRTWTAEEKRASVLEGRKGATSATEIGREHQIAQPQDSPWRERCVERGKRAWTKGAPATEEALQREIEQLERLIGQQAVAIEG